HHAPVAQWIERLTSNCTRWVNTVYMGVISVHPLDGVNSRLSIEGMNSILSIPVAPDLHQNYIPNHLVWRLGF
ncbi:MAG: hypothetical protein WBB69_05010, partial [Anaerolineales bacterium]